MKCLFLGYDSKKTKLINFLRKKKIKVKSKKTSLLFKDIEDNDFIISFGYRKIIKKNLILKAKRPIINLHMSYLPYNRGAHPNFWSFVNNTIKGVTIHEIDEGIDTGKIIFQKRIKFDLKKNPKMTFKQTYNILFNELENLFIKNFKKIIFNRYNYKKNIMIKNSFKKNLDLPKNIKKWDLKILDYLKNLN
jgi:methionyl-tRNA formyltransferase